MAAVFCSACPERQGNHLERNDSSFEQLIKPFLFLSLQVRALCAQNSSFLAFNVRYDDLVNKSFFQQITYFLHIWVIQNKMKSGLTRTFALHTVSREGAEFEQGSRCEQKRALQ